MDGFQHFFTLNILSMNYIESENPLHEQRLKRWREISNQLLLTERCIDSIAKNKADGINAKAIVYYFLTWDSIGTNEVKGECGEIALNAILEHLRDKKTDLQNEFNSL